MNLTESPVAEIAKKLQKKEIHVERALQHLKTDKLSLDVKYANSDDKLSIMDSIPIETNYDDTIFTEQVLDMYKIPERDKRITKLVMQGYSLAEAARMTGENVKATNQRRIDRRKRYQSKKHLIYG